MKIRKNKNGAISLLMIGIVIAVIAVIVIASGTYIMYKGDKYPGCVFADGASEGTTTGVVDIGIEVVRHYNYMAQTNTLGITTTGDFDQIMSSEMSNYELSFMDWLGSLLPAEAINEESTGYYTFTIESSGDVVYELDGDLKFMNYEQGDVSDTIARVTLPNIFLSSGIYVITITVELGETENSKSITWNC
jgi:hypothetical protein